MKRNSFVPLLLAFCCTSALAETTGPIQIEADQLELDQKKGISLYQGHVRLQRGDTLIQAERVELHSKDGKVTQAIADGTPVHLEMHDTQSGKTTRGEASHVEYHFNEGSLELQGKAQLWRDGDRFTGERLLYDSNKQQIRAFGSDKKNGRVQVILQPEKEQQK
jgi:lipopolysaccharide export system protein LptA